VSLLDGLESMFKSPTLFRWGCRVLARRLKREVQKRVCGAVVGHDWSQSVGWGGTHEFCTRCPAQRNHRGWKVG
jgi:hypothetical protein